tara:strand:- start:2100 stop:2717 length:618 start_codon:yes stop_codon:yes gene_type:complete
MPNWCNNSINISGSTETIKTLWDEANKEGSGLLDAMKPMPKELDGTTSPTPQEGQAGYKGPQPKIDGFDNWYDWRVKNWGTKWDIDPKEGLEFTDNGDGTAQISGWFESAWAPPIQAYDTFLDDMDGCSLTADYHEPGMDFAGFYDNGDDQYMEGLGEWCEAVVKGTCALGDTPELFQKLDEEFELVENAREWIEEQMEEETVNG